MDIKDRAALVRELRCEMKQRRRRVTREEYDRGLDSLPGETNEQWVARQNARIRAGDPAATIDPARLGYGPDRTARPPARSRRITRKRRRAF